MTTPAASVLQTLKSQLAVQRGIELDLKSKVFDLAKLVDKHKMTSNLIKDGVHAASHLAARLDEQTKLFADLFEKLEINSSEPIAAPVERQDADTQCSANTHSASSASQGNTASDVWKTSMSQKKAKAAKKAAAPKTAEAGAASFASKAATPKAAQAGAASSSSSSSPKAATPASSSGAQPLRTKPPRAKLEAIAFKITDQPKGASYAEALKKLRGAINVEEIGCKISGVRRSQGGEILLEVEKGGATSALATKVAEVLGSSASVRRLTPTTSIEIRDLDEGVEKEDVVAAIRVLEGSAQCDVLSLRPSYGGTIRAIVRMPSEAASRVVGEGKLKVGWVNCRIRACVQVTRCYKCHGYGHMANKCKRADSTELCLTCGLPGHKAATCTGTPSCLSCKGAGKSSFNHRSGSGACATYKEELLRRSKAQK
jgi:hypothetical protein